MCGVGGGIRELSSNVAHNNLDNYIIHHKIIILAVYEALINLSSLVVLPDYSVILCRLSYVRVFCSFFKLKLKNFQIFNSSPKRLNSTTQWTIEVLKYQLDRESLISQNRKRTRFHNCNGTQNTLSYVCL